MSRISIWGKKNASGKSGRTANLKSRKTTNEINATARETKNIYLSHIDVPISLA